MRASRPSPRRQVWASLALWQETQHVTVDTDGQYAVLLGASVPDGLPQDLFASGEARWLGRRFERSGEPEQPHIGRFTGQTHDQVEVARVARLTAVGFRRRCLRAWMGVVEADDLEPTPARVAKRIEVILRIDQILRRRHRSDVAGGYRFTDETRGSEQESTALARRLRPRVSDNGSKRAAPELNGRVDRATECRMPNAECQILTALLSPWRSPCRRQCTAKPGHSAIVARARHRSAW